MDSISWDDQMDTLGSADVDPPAPSMALDRVGPDARGIDDLTRIDLQILSGFEAACRDACHACARHAEAFCSDTGKGRGTMNSSRSNECERMPRIIDLCIPILDAAHHAIAT